MCLRGNKTDNFSVDNLGFVVAFVGDLIVLLRTTHAKRAGGVGGVGG